MEPPDTSRRITYELSNDRYRSPIASSPRASSLVTICPYLAGGIRDRDHQQGYQRDRLQGSCRRPERTSNFDRKRDRAFRGIPLGSSVGGLRSRGLRRSRTATLRLVSSVTSCFSRASRARARSTQSIKNAAIGQMPAGVWELGSSEAIKCAAREGLGLAFLTRYAVAEEVERGDLESFRLAGRPPSVRHFLVARLAGRPLSPAEQSFVTTLTRCCAKQADYAAACVGETRQRKSRVSVV